MTRLLSEEICGQIQALTCQQADLYWAANVLFANDILPILKQCKTLDDYRRLVGEISAATVDRNQQIRDMPAPIHTLLAVYADSQFHK
jgi:hypothetical protein